MEVPHPFYPHWGLNELVLSDTTIPNFEEPDNAYHRIVSNIDFEICVQHGVLLNKFLPVHKYGSCPPGPFRAPQAFIDQMKSGRSKRKQDVWDKFKDIYTKYKPVRPACALPAGKPGNLVEKVPAVTGTEQKAMEANRVAKLVEKRNIVSHGDLCILVWFVLIPLANYIARFFTDFKNLGCFALGFWFLVSLANTLRVVSNV